MHLNKPNAAQQAQFTLDRESDVYPSWKATRSDRSRRDFVF